MKTMLVIIFIAFFSLNTQAQQKQTLYFSLEKGKFTKQRSIRPVKIKTQRIDTAYSFTLPCNCVSGTINFFRTVNPETGRANLPIRTLKKNEMKQLTFLSLKELLAIMTTHDGDFNQRYNLFLVEKGTVGIAYHVTRMTFFGDYADDRVGP